MKWSFKLGRFLGIDVFIHVTFLLFLAWLGYFAYAKSGSIGAGLHTMGLVTAVFGCVLLHEYGHVLTARKFGIGTHDITLLPIGGVARLERMPSNPRQELLVAIAGPAVNVVIAAVIMIWLKTEQYIPRRLDEMFLPSRDFLVNLLKFNVVMFFFNLLPAFPMDGGRVLRSLLAMRMPHIKATRIAAGIGQSMAIVFVVVALLTGREMLLLVALFVWVGAGREAEDEEEKSRLGGLLARDAMMTDYRLLLPQDTARHAVSLILQSGQTDFPVVENGRLLGLVTRQDVVDISGRDDSTPVSSFMRGGPPECDAGEHLDVVMERIHASDLPLMHVVENGLLRGLVTVESVGQALTFRRPRRPVT